MDTLGTIPLSQVVYPPKTSGAGWLSRFWHLNIAIFQDLLANPGYDSMMVERMYYIKYYIYMMQEHGRTTESGGSGVYIIYAWKYFSCLYLQQSLWVELVSKFD